MRSISCILAAGLLVSAPATVAEEPEQPLVVIDEDHWIVFYDVPSRRFRDIRDAFVRGDFDQAASDLRTSASYLEIEADRALPALAERLQDLATQMSAIAENIHDPNVTTGDLDPLFGRGHWLLAQHYLDRARRSRDAQQHRNAGRYLWATTHHLERAVIWSNARISRKLQAALDDLRDMASRLQNEKLAAQAYREKPIAAADKVLRELGDAMDRNVVLPTQ